MEEVIEEVSLFEDGKPEVKVVEDAAPEAAAAPTSIPEKFQGKSLEDVVESYVNLEKEYGNKANEVGELRKLTDQILQNHAAPAQATPVEEQVNNDVGFDDFIDNPTQAVDRVLDANPRLQRLEASLQDREHEIARNALLAKHEDADAVVASPEFLNWAQESAGRLRMLQDAHNGNDAALAGDLIDTFKATRQAATDIAIDERDAIAAGALQKASVTTGSVPADTKKVYRRSELIDLKIRDPQRYTAMSQEITKAYAEGRVK